MCGSFKGGSLTWLQRLSNTRGVLAISCRTLARLPIGKTKEDTLSRAYLLEEPVKEDETVFLIFR